MVQRSVGITALGRAEHAQELQLGGILQKRVCTVDYDFAGSTLWGLRGQSAGLGVVAKNSFYYRITASGLYAPVMAVYIASVTGSAPISDLVVKTPQATVFPDAATVRLFDASANIMRTKGDSESDVVVIKATPTATTVTLSDVFEAEAASSDVIMMGIGVENVKDWVIFDQSLDLSSSGKPAQLAADFTNSFIYAGRVNVNAISQWAYFPAAFKAFISAQLNGRIFLDQP